MPLIELDENDYILGLWFCSDKDDNNWLLVVKKTDKGWEGGYRFRYIKDDNIFDSQDEKNFYKITYKKDTSEEEIIKSIKGLQEFISIKYPFIDKLIIKGNVQKFIDLSKTKPWCHMKVENIK